MSKAKVAVVGASGLVGAALCERLFFDGELEPVPLLHNPGKGARVARLGIQLRIADLLDLKQVLDGIADCDYIVNCSRDGAAVMINGLKNLLSAAGKTRAKGLIHISSAAIYADSAFEGTITEQNIPRPADEYAAIKLQQDEIVLRYSSPSLRCLVLCPPTISGPYSDFILGLIKTVREGRLPLLDGGQSFSNVVQVDNLVQAIVTALHSDSGWGERYLINETEKITWLQFFEDIRKVVRSNAAFIPVSSGELRPPQRQMRKQVFSDNFKTLLSGEFRNALSLIPAFRALNQRAYIWFSSTSPEFQSRIRRRLQRPTLISKQPTQRPLDEYLVRIQSRKVYYSPEKLISQLKFHPILTYDQGIQTLRSWLEFAALA